LISLSFIFNSCIIFLYRSLCYSLNILNSHFSEAANARFCHEGTNGS